MNKFLLTVLAMAMTGSALVAPAVAADVGLSISVGEPGFYGRLDIGDFPHPELIYSQPVIVERAEVYGSRPPMYLRVPPGHEKHWRQHCHEYHACGYPVYFVRDRWYEQTYVPHYREHGHGHGKDKQGGKHD